MLYLRYSRSSRPFEKPKDQCRLSPNFLSQVENAISMTKLKDDEYGPFIRFITLQLHKMDEEQVELFKELSINDVAEMQVLAGSVVEEEVERSRTPAPQVMQIGNDPMAHPA